jgi:hypothetical protein
VIPETQNAAGQSRDHLPTKELKLGEEFAAK